jgi:hypothetical protein
VKYIASRDDAAVLAREIEELLVLTHEHGASSRVAIEVNRPTPKYGVLGRYHMFVHWAATEQQMYVLTPEESRWKPGLYGPDEFAEMLLENRTRVNSWVLSLNELFSFDSSVTGGG